MICRVQEDGEVPVLRAPDIGDLIAADAAV